MKIADLDAARRRLLTLHARSAAVLRLGDAQIQELEAVPLAIEDEEPRRLAARQKFRQRLWLVRRMANGQPIYETVEGLDCIMYAPADLNDKRIVAIEGLAKLLKISVAELDAETNRILEVEESNRACVDALAETFMAKLPKTPRRHAPEDRKSPAADRRSWRRIVNYDDAKLREVVCRLPDRDSLPWSERERLEAELLCDLGEQRRCDADIDGPGAPSTVDSPARRASMLLAACELAGKYDDARRDAVKRKSAILLREFPRGAGDGTRYAARSSDLDAELIQPLSEPLNRFRRLVVKFAARVAAASTWPPGGSQFDRALALGRTVQVEEADLATARASLGHARMETTKHGESDR